MKFWEGSYLLPIQGNQREETLFGLKFQWMLPVHYAVDVWFQLAKKNKSKSASNTRDYRIYVTGVVVLIIMIRIAK